MEKSYPDDYCQSQPHIVLPAEEYLGLPQEPQRTKLQDPCKTPARVLQLNLGSLSQESDPANCNLCPSLLFQHQAPLHLHILGLLARPVFVQSITQTQISTHCTGEYR